MNYFPLTIHKNVMNVKALCDKSGNGLVRVSRHYRNRAEHELRRAFFGWSENEKSSVADPLCESAVPACKLRDGPGGVRGQACSQAANLKAYHKERMLSRSGQSATRERARRRCEKGPGR